MQFESRFGLGDSVWFMHENKPTCGPVCMVQCWADGRHPVNQVCYTIINHGRNDHVLNESQVFETKIGLLNSL